VAVLGGTNRWCSPWCGDTARGAGAGIDTVAQAFVGNGLGFGSGALHHEPCCATGGDSSLRSAASSLGHDEMAAVGLVGVAPGACGEANRAWVVR
jgi:hypothetical protein